jgi:O-succinylhomoserine sulfhydrylase
VEQVFYAGLPEHPGHALAARQQSAFGGVLSFRVRGGREAAWRLIDATRLMSLTANLGDAKTTIVHPATTTHGRLSAEERADAGITENLIASPWASRRRRTCGRTSPAASRRCRQALS